MAKKDSFAPKFEVNSNVFAKMKGYPPWPSYIEAINDITPNKIKYTVHYYGTRNVSICKEQDIFSYEEHKDRLGKPRKSKSFNLGMAELKADIYGLKKYQMTNDNNNQVQKSPNNNQEQIMIELSEDED